MSVESVRQRWEGVKNRVEAAAKGCGRDPKDILIVGVTKFADTIRTRELYDAGCRDLGESRPQSLWEKAEALKDLPIRWHMIGHLQRNKARRTIPFVDCIHSVDSLRLAQQLDLDASDLDKVVRILVEVDVTGDANKTGLRPRDLLGIASAIIGLPHLRLIGVMGMAGLDNRDPRSDFAAIRQLRDQLQGEIGSQAQLEHLSMGMSGDFEAAIQEGATIIRVGSILFRD